MRDVDEAAAVTELEIHRWEMPSHRHGEFVARIARANKRLAAAGLDARFEVAYEDFEIKKNIASVDHSVVSHHGSVYILEPWVRATLTGPLTLRHGHFTFVARLVPEEAGFTVHTAPGQELGGFVPRGDTACEHCGVDRARTRLYLVRDDRDATIMQLGHTCIELYTGVSPKGLWALTFDEELDKCARDEGGGFGQRDYGAPIDAVIAYSWVHSDHGRAYKSATGYGPSTAGRVRTSLFASPNTIPEPDRAYFEAKAAEAALCLRDSALLDAIKDSVTTTFAESDYGRNLRVILAGETVSGRNIGILASLVKVYARAQQIEAERKAAPKVVSGFVGEIGERVRNISGVATVVSCSENQWGDTTFLVGIADTGHTLVWSASRDLGIERGQRFTITAATVKAHGEYNGTDQTVITRAAGFEAVAGQASVA